MDNQQAEQSTNFVEINEVNESKCPHDYYQIKTSILALLIYLPILKLKNKPILIHQSLFQPYQYLLEPILNQQGLSYELYINNEENIAGVFQRYNLNPRLVNYEEENLSQIIKQNNIKIPFVTENEFAKRLKSESTTSLVIDSTPFYKSINQNFALYSAEQIMELDDSEFYPWIDFIISNPTKGENSGRQPHDYPSPAWLHECWCHNQENSRNSKINLREQYENRIAHALSSYDKKEEIHLLSLGSGGLFQDFMIILRLYTEGFTHIHLDCVEIIDNSKQQGILTAIVNRLNLNNVNIKTRHFKTIDEIKEGQIYDSIYAIDFDKGVQLFSKDGSSRQLKHRCPSLQTNELTALFFNAYAKLAHTPSALFLLTVGENFLALQNEPNEYKFNSFLGFEEVIENNSYHDYYYINANIFSFLIHLSFLKKQNKPLLINENIVNPKVKESLLQILSQQGFAYKIASEKTIAEMLDEELATVLIIDDTAFDNSNKNESWIDKQFNNGCVQMARWKSSIRRNIIAPSFIDIKGQQLIKTITQMTTLDFVKNIVAGIELYQQFISKTTLPTCSLWHIPHNDSKFAKKLKLQLMSIIEQSEASHGSKVDQNLKNSLYLDLHSTSSEKFSISRFIYASLLNDVQLQQLSSEDFQKLKLYLIASGNLPLLQYKTPKPEKNDFDNALRDSIVEECVGNLSI
ncbi:MAG: hypothetical protein H0U57_05475 [Tatlockia sp.]|nr:hypothetical protein [Tatlockia sp.]